MASGEEHQVLQFRPRGRRAALPRQVPAAPEHQNLSQGLPQGLPEDLSRYEARDEPDDFRHRMITNAIAFAAAVALTVAGVWLAISIADLRKTQDCAFMNRRDCVQTQVR